MGRRLFSSKGMMGLVLSMVDAPGHGLPLSGLQSLQELQGHVITKVVLILGRRREGVTRWVLPYNKERVRRGQGDNHRTRAQEAILGTRHGRMGYGVWVAWVGKRRG